MSNQIQRLKIKKTFLLFGFWFLFVIWILTFGIFYRAKAATEFFTSWQAKSYAPYFYQGKVLPSNNSNITVSFELIVDGKPANLSGRSVRWYLDNNLYQSGIGLKTISFKADPLKRDNYQIKISLPKYSQGADLEDVFTIPLTSPEVIIDAPYPDLLIQAGTNVFRGLLYFFNINNLQDIAFEWVANGQSTEANPSAPDILELAVPRLVKGERISLRLGAKNKNNNLEFASEEVNLIVK